MSDSQPLVSIVILSYSWTRHLKEALQSLVSQSYPSLEILLVDNKGPDTDQVRRIAGAFPSVQLIQNEANLGFTGGMNVGVKAAKGHYVYLTEDDVVLRRDCIATLVAFVNGHPDVGLAAPIMYNKREGTIRSAGGRFSLGSIYRVKIFGEGQADVGQFCEPFDVTYIPGASIFARSDELKAMNGFREDFFIYHEDAELCVRMLKSGRRIVSVPAAKVDHFEPPAGKPSDFIDFLRLKNFYAMYLLHAPARALPGFLYRYSALTMARGLIKDRRQVKLMLKAWGWVIVRLPRLLAERDRRPFPAQVGLGD